MFGHWVLPIPDLSGDGLADVVIAAPHARVADVARGIVVARSPKTGDEIWQHAEPQGENLGWDLALAGDQNGDGKPDLFVGAPAQDSGKVLLLSGSDGSVLQTYAPPADGGSFGWYVARLDDLDGDGRPDLAVGGPAAAGDDGVRVGAAWILSSASGKVLQHWTGSDRRGGFGGIVASVADIDGDGKGEVAVAAPGTEDQTRTVPGEVRIYSTRTGKELRHWTGTQPGELYGRMVVATDDLDGDGVADIAVSAPWYRRGAADQVGRVELRSGRTGEILGAVLGTGLGDLQGDEPGGWFGWHVRRAPDPDGRGRPTLLVGTLRASVGDARAIGTVDLYVLRPPAHGTVKRGARRKDIK